MPWSDALLTEHVPEATPPIRGLALAPPAPVADPGEPSFEAMFETYNGLVTVVCRSILGNTPAAEDAMQETYLAAFVSFGSFTAGEPVAPWLATIARRRCWDYLRRTWLRTEFCDGLSPASDGPPAPLITTIDDDLENIDAALDARERARSVSKVLRKLPRRQRHAFERVAFEGWTHQQIADELSVSVRCVKSLVFRARRALRASFLELDPDEDLQDATDAGIGATATPDSEPR